MDSQQRRQKKGNIVTDVTDSKQRRKGTVWQMLWIVNSDDSEDRSKGTLLQILWIVNSDDSEDRSEGTML